jgi:hypothetical protein
MDDGRAVSVSGSFSYGTRDGTGGVTLTQGEASGGSYLLTLDGREGIPIGYDVLRQMDFSAALSAGAE